ncbi:MAG: magnesium transporter [Gemmatimonadaceae bacterium]|nr:magnesium transporter [Gemmatimonadaceae bacterium]
MTPDKPHNVEQESLAALLAPDILDLLETEPGTVAAETEDVHPADLADVAEALPHTQVPVLLATLPAARAAAVLEYLKEELRTRLLEEMSPEQAATLVAAMTPDDRADTLEEIGGEHAEDIVEALPAETRAVTERLLLYPPHSAGGLMTTDVVSVPATYTAEEALRRVREIARSGRREAMNVVYTLDAAGGLSGVMSLRELLAAPEGARMADVAWPEVRKVAVLADREEVARLISEYDLVAVPVVDDANRLLGVVTFDDVIDVIQEEQTEDVQKLGGVEAFDAPYMQMSIGGMLRKRAGWLSVLMVSEMFTTQALQHFDAELEKLPVLMLFIPLVMSSGGNSGSQATSLITRAMALKEVRLKDWWRVALRELPTGLALGALLGAIGFARVELWQMMHDSGAHLGSFALGYDYTSGGTPSVLVALNTFFALVGIVTFGSMTGSMLPFILRRFGFDPASASAPFVATLVDVSGLVIYFTVALVVLGEFMG